MSRESSAVVALLIACVRPSPASAALLQWTYPCAFTLEGKATTLRAFACEVPPTQAQSDLCAKLEDGQVPDDQQPPRKVCLCRHLLEDEAIFAGDAAARDAQTIVCDAMHAQAGPESSRQFNSLGTLDAQEALLNLETPNAGAAYGKYLEDRQAVIKRYSREIKEAERLKDLLALQAKLTDDSTATFKAFQWEKLDDPSYLDATQRAFAPPPSWMFYWNAFSGLYDELNRKIAPAEARLLENSKNNVAAVAAERLGSADPDDRPVSAVAKAGLKFRGGGVALRPAAAPALDDGLIMTVPPPLETSPVPIKPDLKQALRNYFSRGAAAGAKGIKDDLVVAYWHARGLSRTVGNPDGASVWVFQQKGPSCAIAAQYEALEVRGYKGTVEDLAKRARAQGLYIELKAEDGLAGGTLSQDIGKVLTLGDKTLIVSRREGTPENLDAALTLGPHHDAIVVMSDRLLWDDPKIDALGEHVVYVTGEEVRVDKATGRTAVLGYYINDTGTGEGKRYLAKADFLRAWKPAKNLLVTIDDAP